jgi:hypothetical protein
MAAADHSLAAALGIQAKVVIELRTGAEAPLAKGQHWTADDTGRVTYTAEGEALVRHLTSPEKKSGGAGPEVVAPAVNPWTTACHLPPPVPADSPAADQAPRRKKKGGAAADGPGEVVMVVIGRRCPNRTWIQIVPPDAGRRLQNVRVRDNRKMRQGQRLKCRKWPDGRWECCHPGQAVRLQALPPKGEA